MEKGIGRSLESARKSRGLSLWQVEEETRIRSRYLRDLEREDFDVLPAVYVLGSLKTYADFLGLDGAALSRQLKASLIEPDEPDVAAQAAVIGGARDEEDEYEAAPVPAVGFDQLFLGMGVILISILAIMTLAAAVAQGDRSPVSQVDQPSTPEPPSEIALAGNVQDGEEEGDGTAGNEENGRGNAPEASKGDDQGEEEDQEKDQNASQATSSFGDAEFVPVSPPSTSSATSAASASASPAPSTAKPDDSSTSAAPASRERSRPANDSPRATSAPSDASAPAATPAPAQAPSPAGPRGGGGSSPQGPASGSGPISADVDRMIGEVFRENGLD